MQVTNVLYSGGLLEVPVVKGSPLHMLHDDWKDWGKDTYWGPGPLGDHLVPDIFPGGTHMQAVCYIHDKCYWYGDPVIADWYLSNEMFMNNMVSAVFAQRTRAINAIENGDLYRAVTYYTAVDLSPAGYIRVKERQGHDLTGFYK